jgi:CubicO group peptidase (beta-lactamase class C family)
MKKSKLSFIILLVSFSFLSFAQNPNPNATIDNFILDEMDAENIPGMSTLIVKNGEIIWKKSYGFADVDENINVDDNTIFLLASLSKVFTGTALMKLNEDGLIKLDDHINDHLPFTIKNPNHENIPITFRMLMTHTASINENDEATNEYYSVGDPTITLADAMKRYFSTSGSDYSATKNFLNGAPGTEYKYSNMGSALSGYLVEVISKMPFDEYCNTKIFDKLCMDNTAWYLEDLNIEDIARPYKWENNTYNAIEHYGFADYPNGQLRSSINDLANFTIAYLQDGKFNNQEMLNGTSINEMLKVQNPNIDMTQGLAFYTKEIALENGASVELWGHNGGESGASTDLYMNPENKIGVVVISNSRGKNDAVIEKLYNHGLTLATKGVGNPTCSGVGILSTDKNGSDINNFKIKQISTDGNFLLESQKNNLKTIFIYNTLGQLILTKNLSNKSSSNFTLEKQGLYFINLITANGRQFSTKLIKE